MLMESTRILINTITPIYHAVVSDCQPQYQKINNPSASAASIVWFLPFHVTI